MTREEAIQKAMDIHASTGSHAQYFVDVLVALGVLKLDEPKGPNERAVDAMFGHPSCPLSGVITPRHALEAIDRAGLKIVEK